MDRRHAARGSRAGAGHAQPLHGRGFECQELQDLVSRVRSGSSHALVLRGEAGIGKSALLDHVVAQADGFRITRVAGVESDMELAFAGLQQLCTPLMDRLGELPDPQRDALTVAFGQGSGATPDRFLVGLAVLSLMAAASSDQPLLCVVDDAQWLDQVSVQTLAFVARRLLAEPIAMVFAARDTGADALTGLPELHVDGLTDADARELLNSVVVGRLDERVRDRIIAETRGNPLALLELPHHNMATEMLGGVGCPVARPLARRLEQNYVGRIRALPPDTQRLLLAAAAEPVGDAAVLIRAAAHLGIPVDLLAPAEAAGVIELGTRVRFRHPLVRAAAYQAADLTERRAVHRALAEATDAATDPDRRAWHAANAATGPDDDVAAELEASADRAQARGGIASAAAFLERAAALTTDPALRGVRALAAARAKRDAAAPAEAYELLAMAELGRLSEEQQAHATRLRAQMEFTRRRGGDPNAWSLEKTASRLVTAAEVFEKFDPYVSQETYLEALAAAMYAGRLGDAAAVTRIAADASEAVDRLPTSPRPVDSLLRGVVERIAGGDGTGTGQLRTAMDLMQEQAHSNDNRVTRWLVPAFPIMQESAAHELWDDAIVANLATAVERRARDAGALAALPQVLAYRAGVHLLAGELDTAATLLEEAASITEATNGYPPVRYHAMVLAAWQGDLTDAVRVMAAATADGTARGEGRVLGVVGYAGALLHNGLARYDEALLAARQACEYEDQGFHGWCLAELVEAAAHCGETAVAEDAADRLGERAADSGTDWGLGVLAGARALVADPIEADTLFVESIERLQRTRVTSQLARSHLRYGEWLRRTHRRNDARRHLTVAHDMFTRFGAQAFAERTRRELLAAGEKTRRQPVTSGDRLTAQESQIARLASGGLTNQEIAAQLFISTHTVDWHLRKVFVKLGITSRRQLRGVSWAS